MPVVASLTGSTVTRFGQDAEFELQIINRSQEVVPLSFVTVEIPDLHATVTHDLVESEVSWPVQAVPGDPFVGRDGRAQYLMAFVTGVTPGAHTVARFVLHRDLAAGESGSTLPLRAAALPLETSPANPPTGFHKRLPPTGSRCFDNFMSRQFQITLSDLAPLPCLTSLGFNLAVGVGAELAQRGFAQFSPRQLIIESNILADAALCAAITRAEIVAATNPVTITAFAAANIVGMFCVARDIDNMCEFHLYDGTPLEICDFDFLEWVTSMDPNDKAGFGSSLGAGYVRDIQERVAFRVRFENDAGASAPAQVVRIVDAIDASSFDIDSIQLISAQFGRHELDLRGTPVNTAHYVDLRPEQQIIVEVRVELSEDGAISWRFTSLDPVSMSIVSDPLLGFLPPNAVAPNGEGAVHFSIAPHPFLANGQLITNRAVIYFDEHFGQNQPIETNLWSATVDGDLPIAQIDVASVGLDKVRILASASDPTSGIRRIGVDIDDGSPGDPVRFWADNGDTLVFSTLDVDRLSFSAFAEDGAGNIGDHSSELLVDGARPRGHLDLRWYPAGARAGIVIEAAGSLDGFASVYIHDVRGRHVATLSGPEVLANGISWHWSGRDDAGRLAASGVYLARVETADYGKALTKLVLLR
ncbi:MAG: hypothetical protein IPG61_08140 [bacterium]|nr:hypothetical protein [bacterium]